MSQVTLSPEAEERARSGESGAQGRKRKAEPAIGQRGQRLVVSTAVAPTDDGKKSRYRKGARACTHTPLTAR